MFTKLHMYRHLIDKMNTIAEVDSITCLDTINEKDDENGTPTVEESLERVDPQEEHIATGGDSSDIMEPVTVTETAANGEQVSNTGVQVVDNVVVTGEDDIDNNEAEVEVEVTSSNGNDNLRRSTRRH